MKTSIARSAVNHWKSIVLALAVSIVCLAATPFALAVDYFSQTSGSPNTLANWNSVRGGGGTSPANFTTAGNRFIIQDTHTMTTTATWTVSGSGSQVVIEGGGRLINANTVSFTSSATGLVENSGTYEHAINGGAVPTFTWNPGSTCLISGATSSTPTALGQAFHHFTWNCPSQSQAVNLTSGLTTVNGNFTVVNTAGFELRIFGSAGGTCNVAGGVSVSTGASLGITSATAGSSVLNIGGNFSIPNGAGLAVSGSAGGAINFNGSGSQTLSILTPVGTTATTFRADRIAWKVNAGSTLTLNSHVTNNVNGVLSSFTVSGTLNCGANLITGSGIFTNTPGSKLILGATDGIAASGNTGNIRTTTRSFNAGATYVYSGVAAQISGTGLPSPVHGLTVNNTSGLTLTTSPTTVTNFNGTGSVGNTVAVAATGVLSPGNSPGTLTVSSLNIDAVATNYFELTNSVTVGGGVNDLLIVTDTLIPNGSQIAISNYGPNELEIGTYRLVDYSAGSLSGASFNATPVWLSALANVAGTTATIVDDTVNQHINLVIAAAGGPTHVNVETAADGSGSVVSAQNIAAGNAINVYAISRTADETFVANVAGTWSLTGVSGGVVNGDLVPAGDDKSATFTGHLVGSATIHVTSGVLTPGDSGTLTVIPGTPADVRVETAANGSGAVVPAQNVASGNSLTAYSITRDAYGNFVANVAADGWSLVNKTGGVVDGDLVPNGDSKSAVFTGGSIGTANLSATSGVLAVTDSGTITVINPATYVSVETAADGSGSVVSAQNIAAGSSVTVYAIARAANNTFVENIAATWSLAEVSGGVDNGDLVVAGDDKSATFTGRVIGSAKIHAVAGVLTPGDSGTLTVIPGTATLVRVETAANGSGTIVPAQNVTSGDAIIGYSIRRDAYTNFVDNVAADAWSLVSKTGGVADGDLVAAGDNKSATFTGSLAGTAKIHATSGALSPIDSGTLTVVAGAATQVRVETAANGSGTVVPTRNVTQGSSITVFSIRRDAAGNFIDNAVADAWSLPTTTGSVVAGDLVAAGDSKSATFTGNGLGTAVIRAAVAGLTSVDSGMITVIAPVQYRTVTTGNWNAPGTWEASYDNGSNWEAATNMPAAADGAITVRNGHTVTVTASVTVDQTTIQAGATVILATGQTFTVANGAGTDLDVFGTLQSNASGLSVPTTGGATIVFASTGVYNNNVNGGTAPTATWSDGSLFLITGGTTSLPGMGGQSFYDVTVNEALTAAANLNGNLTTIRNNLLIQNSGGNEVRFFGAAGGTATVGGNITVNSGGALGISSATANPSTINIGGNLAVAGTLAVSGSYGVSINFNGTGNQTLSVATLSSPNRYAWKVNSGSTVTLNSALTVTAIGAATVGGSFTVDGTLNCGANVISGTGVFTVSSGGTLGIGSTGGIASSGATGNIQTTTRNFNAAANYIYNGGAAQITGTGLPATVNNLTIANAAGVTLNTAHTVSGVATVNPGALLLGPGTINGAAIINGTLAPGTSIGTFTVGQPPTLNGTIASEINKAGVTFTADKLNVTSGTLAYNGTLTVTLLGGSDALSGGEVFDLFDAPGFSGAFTATNLPALAGGLNWYAGNLTVDGSLKVNRAPTAISVSSNGAPGLSLTIQITGAGGLASDADGDALTVTAGAPTAGTNEVVTIGPDQYITYHNTNEAAASDSFTYTVADGFGGSVTRNINVTFAGANLPAQDELTIVDLGGGQVQIWFLGLAHEPYALEAATDAAPPYTWTTVATLTADNTGLVRYDNLTPTESPTLYRTRRVVVED